MAALIVQSRFAGLMIEDDDASSTERIPKNNKMKANNGTKPEPQKKIKAINSKVQSITRKKKGKEVSAEQWESWKQRDVELVDGSYEDELQQAILLSKLDYEEKKDVNKQLKKDAGKQKIQEELASKNKNKKQQKKKNVMSLNQFNDMVNGEETHTKSNHETDKDFQDPVIKSPGGDTDFFERVIDDTKNELLKDKNNDRVRTRQKASDEVLTRVQFLDALEKKDNEIALLKIEVSSLKKELLTVKSRNKKLCNILGQGEMKDKAEVLVEVERLRGVQTELLAELSTLHTDLERERSKNTDPKAKDKKNSTKKKNLRFDVSAEAILPKESSSGTAG